MKSHQVLFENYLDEIIFDPNDPLTESSQVAKKRIDRLLKDLQQAFGLDELFKDIEASVIQINHKTENDMHKAQSKALIQLISNIKDDKASKMALFIDLRELFEKEKSVRKYMDSPLPLEESIRTRFAELSRQLGTWRCKHLARLCLKYLCSKDLKKVHSNMLQLIPSKLANNFIIPLTEYIRSLQDAFLGKHNYYVQDDTMKSDVKNFIEQATDISADNEITISDDTDTEKDADFDEDLKYAKDALRLVGMDVDQESIELIMIKQNPSLKMALSASGRYLDCTENQDFSKKHGRNTTVQFIRNLMNLEDKSKENIQSEAQKYIKGTEKYRYASWWRFLMFFIGGGSSHHKYSRTSYMVKSGVFDNLLEKHGLFAGTGDIAFRQGKKERKVLTEKLKSLMI